MSWYQCSALGKSACKEKNLKENDFIMYKKKRKSAKLKDSRKQLCYQLENIISLLNSCTQKVSPVRYSLNHYSVFMAQHSWWDRNEKLLPICFAGPGWGAEQANIIIYSAEPQMLLRLTSQPPLSGRLKWPSRYNTFSSLPFLQC